MKIFNKATLLPVTGGFILQSLSTQAAHLRGETAPKLDIPISRGLMNGGKPNKKVSTPKSFENPAKVLWGNCEDDEKSRLQWAFRYLRAVSTSKSLKTCLKTAVHKKFDLETDHEFESVGPYAPCYKEGGDFDPEFIREGSLDEQQDRAYHVIMDILENEGKSQNIQVTCESTDSGNSVYTTGDPWEYDDASEKTYKMRVNRNKVFEQYPNHYEDGWPLYDTFGSINKEEDEAYPIDEVAGIFLHHMLLPLGFIPNGDACGWTANDCDGLNEGETCRANSLPEIAEACVSEVVQLSLNKCDPMTMCEDSEIPIWKGDAQSGKCKCEEYW